MSGGDVPVPAIVIWPLSDASSACSLDPSKRAPRPATWRVDVSQIPSDIMPPFGTTAYVCDGCLAPFLRALTPRWVTVSPPPAEQPASAASSSTAPRRKKAGAS